MAIVLDAGADDLKLADSVFEITSDAAAFNQVQAALQKANLTPLVAEIMQVAKVPAELDLETGKKVVRLMDTLDDNEDVQHVYSNANVSEEMVMNADSLS